jgi:hypothetical protein
MKLSGANGLRTWGEDERGISVSVMKEPRNSLVFVVKERLMSAEGMMGLLLCLLLEGLKVRLRRCLELVKVR